jgi:hypothetical protein
MYHHTLFRFVSSDNGILFHVLSWSILTRWGHWLHSEFKTIALPNNEAPRCRSWMALPICPLKLLVVPIWAWEYTKFTLTISEWVWHPADRCSKNISQFEQSICLLELSRLEDKQVKKMTKMQNPQIFKKITLFSFNFLDYSLLLSLTLTFFQHTDDRLTINSEIILEIVIWKPAFFF